MRSKRGIRVQVNLVLIATPENRKPRGIFVSKVGWEGTGNFSVKDTPGDGKMRGMVCVWSFLYPFKGFELWQDSGFGVWGRMDFVDTPEAVSGQSQGFVVRQ